MKKLGFIILLMFMSFGIKAQKIESFFINLYTDSLKKGTHNYINVDGKLSNGSWLPLTDKELKFSSDKGTFEGNSLVLPTNPNYNKITITVTLRSDSKQVLSKTIWIKQKPDPEILDSVENLPLPKRKAKKQF